MQIHAEQRLAQTLPGLLAKQECESIRRFSHVAPLLSSGQVLIAGGEDLNAGIARTLATALYDPSSGTWSKGPATAASPTPGQRRC
jgi:hypothetical protein